MQTDFYTKTVLTVIATCLCILVLKETELIPKANAAATAGFNPAAKYGLVPVNPDGSINVKFTETMRVELDRVNCTVPVKETEEVNVRIKNVDSYAFSSVALGVKPYSSDAFNVNIKDVSSNAFFSTTLNVKVKQ